MMTPFIRLGWFAGIVLAAQLAGAAGAADRPQWSGIYPHLAHFNEDGECGTGAVVPWADRLWVVTYSPHRPLGSPDKLYEINDALEAVVHPESIGGTPANRMIHRESGQLFIGPYAIDRERRVRVIPYGAMPGRPTGNARHLTDPANKIYYATMEEGFYEVDVHTLAVTELYRDANSDRGGHAGSLLPGYHGKGLYSGQGRLIYANNGELSPEAMRRPDLPSGCLAEWDGRDWIVVRRNQFTEVTGPGGILGNPTSADDPIWSVGWDHRSLLLMVRSQGHWRCFRLPKAAHTYDGAHGWNTEWPRIRDVGPAGRPDLLMTMHGMFWRFPVAFTTAQAAGIRPRSTYLKVIGDFCRWNDRLVFGCDDTAKSEFLNKRQAKGNLAGPGQSQSNLWFTDPDQPDRLGTPLGRGAVWLNDRIRAGEWSDPYLFAGFERRAAHLTHEAPEPLTFEFEIDRLGNNQWQALRAVTVPARSYAWVEFPLSDSGEWIRVRVNRGSERTTALFTGANADPRSSAADTRFDRLAKVNDPVVSAGLLRTRGENKRTLHLAAVEIQGREVRDTGYYELGTDMELRRVEDASTHAWLKTNVAIPQGVLSVDAASVLYRDDAGRRWRLPKGDEAFDAWTGVGLTRIDREVVTERDLFNSHGTFYELPAENAGGFAKIRPIATHNRRIADYCSYRGLLVMTGLAASTAATRGDRHVIRSADGRAAVWVGVVDDLWKLGKAVGRGGPWRETPVRAGQPSDPYLMTGYDSKKLTLSQRGPRPISVRIEVDITGDGQWVTYRTFELPGEGRVEHQFPRAFQAYWLRATASADTIATVQLDYE